MPPEPLGPRRSRPAARTGPSVRVTMYPATPPRPVARSGGAGRAATRELRLAGLLALAAAGLLLAGSMGAAPMLRLGRHELADYHYWAGREAYRRSEAQIVVQREWQKAVALDPTYTRVRLDLARSYIDTQWLGGAVQQAEAVAAGPHSRAQGSLAYTYMGYCHFLLGEKAQGEAQLELATELDPQNSLAQSVLERLHRGGKLPELP